MKVNRNRHGLALRRAPGAWFALAGVVLALCVTPVSGHAQSAGMANLLKRSDRLSAQASDAAGNGQREARARAERHRAEQREAEREGHGNGGSRLSPDERRKLRKNLYDFGRDIYQGG
jgi:hypothetical protein